MRWIIEASDRIEEQETIYDLGFSCRNSEIWVTQQQRKRTNLLLLPQSKKTNTGDLHNLETHTGNITLRLSSATEAGNEDFVILIDEVEATIVLNGIKTCSKIQKKQSKVNVQERRR
jgi:hypothetical protein